MELWTDTYILLVFYNVQTCIGSLNLWSLLTCISVMSSSAHKFMCMSRHTHRNFRIIFVYPVIIFCHCL